MKIFNIIGWIVVAALCIASPIVNELYMYSMAFIGVLLMFVITSFTAYDDIDKEIIDNLK